MRTLITHGRIVNEGKCFDGSLVIEDEVIAEILEGKDAQPAKPVDQTIDAAGCMVMPGIIDSHVHFREPGLTDKATIESESRAAAAGGVTSFFDMPNTVPQTTTLQALDEKFRIALTAVTSTIRSSSEPPTTMPVCSTSSTSTAYPASSCSWAAPPAICW